MATFTALRSLLRDYMAVTTARITDANCGAMINNARRFLARQYDLRYLETGPTSFAMVANQQYFALPTGFGRPLELWYVKAANPNTKINLNQMTGIEAFNAKYPNPTSTGAPVDFIVWGPNVLFGPTPDLAYTAYWNYYILPADWAIPADDAAHDSLSDNAWEAILYRALVEASIYMLEDERAAMFEQKATQYAEQLVLDNRRGARSATRIVSREPG